MIIRVIDIGSNSIKASLYQVESRSHRLLGKHKLSFSLGEIVFTEGVIPDEALLRVAAFINSLPDAHDGQKAHFTFVLATSAVRSAENREAFLRRLSQKIDLEVRVLSGEEESFLIHHGILGQAGIAEDEVIKSIDIGGGSAEISWSKGYEYLFGHSYELGAIRLTKAFLKGRPFSREVFGEMRALALREFEHRYPHKHPPQAVRAFGSSGNVRAIGKMLQSLRSLPCLKFLPDITRGSLEDMMEIAVDRTPAHLQHIFDLSLDRARIIMPAVVVLHASMQHFDIPRIMVSEAGLREGVVHYWSRHGHLNLPASLSAQAPAAPASALSP